MSKSYHMDQCHACGGRRGPGKHSYNLLELPARLSVRLCLPCQQAVAADEPRMFWTLGPICGHKYFRLQAYVTMRLNGLAFNAEGKVATARMADDWHRRHWDENSVGVPTLMQLCARVIVRDGPTILHLAGILPEGHPPWVHVVHEYNYTHNSLSSSVSASACGKAVQFKDPILCFNERKKLRVVWMHQLRCKRSMCTSLVYS
jgi:hypothetical protein